MQIKLGDFLREICIKTVVNNEYPVLTSSKNGIYLQSEYFNKQVASKDNTGYKIIKKGQFTYRAMSDTGEFYPNMLKCVDVGIVSPAYPVFEITNRDIIYPQYLQYFFRSNTFRYNISGLEQGSTRTSIKFNKMKNIKIKLPPLLEQKKVIMILDRVGSLISKRQEQLKYFDELTKSLFIEMFGDPVKNPFMFEKQRLSKIGELERGVSKHRPRNAPELLGGKYPLIQTGEISNSDLYINKFENTYSELGLSQSKLWKKGTLCITIAANIAKTGILTFDSCFPDSVVGFVPNKLTNNIFIHYWFSFFQKILEEEAPESAQKNINLKVLSNLDVIVPPIELQNKFANFVRGTDKSKLAVKKSLEELEILKKSLMQKYFA